MFRPIDPSPGLLLSQSAFSFLEPLESQADLSIPALGTQGIDDEN